MVDSPEINIERAHELSEHIVRLGTERQNAELVEVVHDPSTRPLLDLLPDSSRSRAEAYLRTAKRWEDGRRETNTRRLGEARRALDGLDLELARGLTNKIDGRYLTDEQQEERDDLLLEISARAMEVETMEQAGRELIDNAEPKKGKQPWWRRRRR